MDDAFLKYYEHELDALRRSSQLFAAEFPKVARRLQLGEQECADPYVERLLEGVAFLTARIARKVDAAQSEFPETLLNLTHHALQIRTAAVLPLLHRVPLRLLLLTARLPLVWLSAISHHTRSFPKSGQKHSSGSSYAPRPLFVTKKPVLPPCFFVQSVHLRF